MAAEWRSVKVKADLKHWKAWQNESARAAWLWLLLTYLSQHSVAKTEREINWINYRSINEEDLYADASNASNDNHQGKPFPVKRTLRQDIVDVGWNGLYVQPTCLTSLIPSRQMQHTVIVQWEMFCVWLQ